MSTKKRDIGDSNAEQNEYWIRVGGHPPPGYQDYDDDDKENDDEQCNN